ncbi:hypothetical protein PVK06_024449 [Gossypium arboreum]|uniref:Uncharacterized protein n=1 Tax=Gossypium arboreum TaxID=29729 RepID=A0ABR0PDY9_GOSAR|nr:hypothetical protein PVK06_024449 [Gossypium arboreum]
MADEREIGSFQTYIFDDHHGWHIIWIMEYKNGDGSIWTVISGVNLDEICFHFSFSESFYDWFNAICLFSWHMVEVVTREKH